MNDKDHEWTERYIYQVVRRLPKAQRDDIAMELRELISDMTEEKKSVEAALTKLGDPAEFAKKYMGDSNHLIGPTYYETYKAVLKIAMLCTAISVFFIVLVQGIFDGYATQNISDLSSGIIIAVTALAKACGSCISSAISAFGIVTIVFAIMERQKVDLDEVKEKAWTAADLADKPISEKKSWTPSQLTPIPTKKALIPKGDNIADIVFSVILAALFIFAPQLLGIVWMKNDTVTTIPIFNLDKWNIILPFFLVGLCAGLTNAILRLIIGRYNIKVILSNIIAGAIQIFCAVISLKVLPIWNPDFGRDLSYFLEDMPDDFDCLTCFDEERFFNIFLAVFIFFTIVTIGKTTYRTIRYGRQEDSIK